jgi:hypothetical protein
MLEVNRGVTTKQAEQRAISVMTTIEEVSKREKIRADLVPRERAAELLGKAVCRELIGVEDEDPVAGRKVEGCIARRREVVIPGELLNLCSGALQERDGAVIRAGINDAQLVPTAANCLKEPREGVGFVPHDHAKR